MIETGLDELARVSVAVRRIANRIALLIAIFLLLGAAVWLYTGRPVRYGALARAETLPEEAPSGAYSVVRVTLLTTFGRRFVCTLRSPTRRPDGARVPAMLLLDGRRTGRDAALFVDSSYVGVAMACDYPWGNPLHHSVPGFLLRLPAIRARIMATPQLLGVAAAYLLSRPEVDTARLVAVGASLGVPFVAEWASRDRRPHAVALLYGGGDVALIFETYLSDRVAWAWLRRLVAGTVAGLVARLEPTSTVRGIAPRPILVVGAADDPWVPRRSVEALYEAAGEPKRLVWFSGEHVRTSDAALLRALTDSMLAWYAEIEGGRR